MSQSDDDLDKITCNCNQASTEPAKCCPTGGPSCQDDAVMARLRKLFQVEDGSPTIPQTGINIQTVASKKSVTIRNPKIEEYSCLQECESTCNDARLMSMVSTASKRSVPSVRSKPSTVTARQCQSCGVISTASKISSRKPTLRDDEMEQVNIDLDEEILSSMALTASKKSRATGTKFSSSTLNKSLIASSVIPTTSVSSRFTTTQCQTCGATSTVPIIPSLLNPTTSVDSRFTATQCQKCGATSTLPIMPSSQNPTITGNENERKKTCCDEEILDSGKCMVLTAPRISRPTGSKCSTPGPYKSFIDNNDEPSASIYEKSSRKATVTYNENGTYWDENYINRVSTTSKRSKCAQESTIIGTVQPKRSQCPSYVEIQLREKSIASTATKKSIGSQYFPNDTGRSMTSSSRKPTINLEKTSFKSVPSGQSENDLMICKRCCTARQILKNIPLDADNNPLTEPKVNTVSSSRPYTSYDGKSSKGDVSYSVGREDAIPSGNCCDQSTNIIEDYFKQQGQSISKSTKDSVYKREQSDPQNAKDITNDSGKSKDGPKGSTYEAAPNTKVPSSYSGKSISTEKSNESQAKGADSNALKENQPVEDGMTKCTSDDEACKTSMQSKKDTDAGSQAKVAVSPALKENLSQDDQITECRSDDEVCMARIKRKKNTDQGSSVHTSLRGGSDMFLFKSTANNKGEEMEIQMLPSNRDVDRHFQQLSSNGDVDRPIEINLNDTATEYIRKPVEPYSNDREFNQQSQNNQDGKPQIQKHLSGKDKDNDSKQLDDNQALEQDISLSISRDREQYVEPQSTNVDNQKLQTNKEHDVQQLLTDRDLKQNIEQQQTIVEANVQSLEPTTEDSDKPTKIEATNKPLSVESPEQYSEVSEQPIQEEAINRAIEEPIKQPLSVGSTEPYIEESDKPVQKEATTSVEEESFQRLSSEKSPVPHTEDSYIQNEETNMVVEEHIQQPPRVGSPVCDGQSGCCILYSEGGIWKLQANCGACGKGGLRYSGTYPGTRSEK